MKGARAAARATTVAAVLLAAVAGAWTAARRADARVLAGRVPDGGTLLVLEKWSATLSAYDPNSGFPLRSIELGGVPHEMVLSADGKTLYVSDYGVKTYLDKEAGGNTIAIVDVVAGEKAGEISLGGARRPHGIALGKSGRLYLTADTPPAVLVVDPAARAVVARHAIDAKLPHMLAVSRDEKTAYVANSGSGTVSFVRLDGKPGAAAPKAVQVGGTPMGLALSPDDQRLYVTNRDGNALVVLDTASGRTVKRLPMPGAPARVELVAGEPELVVTLIEAGDVAMVDTKRLEVLGRRHVGARAEGLYVDEEGHFMCVSAQGDDKVVKMDLGTMEVLAEITTGQRPDPVVRVQHEFGVKLGIGGAGARTLRERDAGTKLTK